jgi:hypothetical protein
MLTICPNCGGPLEVNEDHKPFKERIVACRACNKATTGDYHTNEPNSSRIKMVSMDAPDYLEQIERLAEAAARLRRFTEADSDDPFLDRVDEF